VFLRLFPLGLPVFFLLLQCFSHDETSGQNPPFAAVSCLSHIAIRGLVGLGLVAVFFLCSAPVFKRWAIPPPPPPATQRRGDPFVEHRSHPAPFSVPLSFLFAMFCGFRGRDWMRTVFLNLLIFGVPFPSGDV